MFSEEKEQLSLFKYSHFIFCWKTNKKGPSSEKCDCLFLKMPDTIQLELITYKSDQKKPHVIKEKKKVFRFFIVVQKDYLNPQYLP